MPVAERSVMAKASLIGLITQGPELQHSAKGEPYVRFSVSVQYSAHEKLNKAYDSYCNSRFRMPCFYEALLKTG